MRRFAAFVLIAALVSACGGKAPAAARKASTYTLTAQTILMSDCSQVLGAMTAVQVRDQHGSIIGQAAGGPGSGRSAAGACALTVIVSGLPKVSFYQVSFTQIAGDSATFSFARLQRDHWRELIGV